MNAARELRETEIKQKRIFNEMSELYHANYDDAYSLRYRERFLFPPLLGDLDLRGKSVLEAMCGAGSVTQHLLARGARVTGVDISERFIEIFAKNWPGSQAICASVAPSGRQGSGPPPGGS